MVKIVCQVCGIVGYLQHIGKNYYRVRHYVGFKNGKPLFKYHRQDPQYVHKLLEQESNIDQIDHKRIDQNLKEHKPFNENMGGPVVQFGMNAAFATPRRRVLLMKKALIGKIFKSFYGSLVLKEWLRIG